MADEKINNSEQETAEDQLSDYDKGEQKKKKMMYIIIFVAQIILAVVLVKFFVIPWYNGDSPNDTSEQQQEEEADTPKAKIGQIYTISDLTVNPKGSRGRRFAIFEIALSLPENPIVLEEIKKYEVILRDNYIQYFRSKSVAELSVDTAMAVIKSDIMQITDEVVGDGKVDDIFFTRFILQ